MGEKQTDCKEKENNHLLAMQEQFICSPMLALGWQLEVNYVSFPIQQRV